MYNWVTRRTVERTDKPQPVFTTIVDQTVRTWMPAMALVAASCVTPARAKLDVRAYDWSASPASWIQATLPTGPTTAQQWPAVEAGTQRSTIPPTRRLLDVRSYDWVPADDWIQKVTATVPVQVAPIASSGAAFRTPARQTLDVRLYDWSPSAGWNVPPAPAATVAQILPALLGASSFRTASKAAGDFRYHDQSTSFGLPDDPVTFDGAIFADDGGRTADRPRLDVRSYDWANGLGWIAATFATPPTTAQIWSTISEGIGQNYRTADRARLDVRAYEWRSDGPTAAVVDATVRALAPVFSSELASVRTADRGRLDVRTFDWAPGFGWIVTTFQPAATTAQIWPAIQQNLGTHYRTAERPRLDVRAYDWSPESGWMASVVDSVVAKWLPVWDAEVSYRTPGKSVLDVRALTSEPEIAWLAAVITFDLPVIVYHNTNVTGTYAPDTSTTATYVPDTSLTGTVD